jgi:hypothetical protein
VWAASPPTRKGKTPGVSKNGARRTRRDRKGNRDRPGRSIPIPATQIPGGIVAAGLPIFGIGAVDKAYPARPITRREVCRPYLAPPGLAQPGECEFFMSLAVARPRACVRSRRETQAGRTASGALRQRFSLTPPLPGPVPGKNLTFPSSNVHMRGSNALFAPEDRCFARSRQGANPSWGASLPQP